MSVEGGSLYRTPLASQEYRFKQELWYMNVRVQMKDSMYHLLSRGPHGGVIAPVHLSDFNVSPWPQLHTQDHHGLSVVMQAS